MSEGLSDERIEHITGCLATSDVAGLAEGFARELLDEVKRLRKHVADLEEANAYLREINEQMAQMAEERKMQAVAYRALAEEHQKRGDKLDARLAEAHEEWGQKYSGGGYLTRVDCDWMSEHWPIEQWAWDNTRHGGVVGKRTIIVVEDWQDIRSDDLPKGRPADTGSEVPHA